MPFSWDDYPYTNFHELNLDWFIKKFKEIFDEWSELYTTLQNWKESTTQELEEWKTGVETDMREWEEALTSALDEWKETTEEDISGWETGVLSDLNDWKDAFETLFDTTFSNLSDIKTDAEAARDRAEAAAVTAEASAESLSSAVYNVDEFVKIKNNLYKVPYTPTNISLDSNNKIYLDKGYINATTGYSSATGSSSSVYGKYYRTQAGSGGANAFLEIGTKGIFVTLGLNWVEWTCYSYSSNTNASATHSNCGDKYISGTESIFIPKNSTDVRFNLGFRGTGDGDANRPVFTDEQVNAIKDAIKFYVLTDDSLTIVGSAADAKITGDSIYSTKSRGEHLPSALTWWEVPNTFTDLNPIYPADVPMNCYTTQLGSLLAGFTAKGVNIAHPGAVYYLFSWRSRHNSNLRFYQIYCTAYKEIYYASSNDAGNTLTVLELPSKKPSAKILWLGDSITRGRIAGENAIYNYGIPYYVGRDNNIVSENFGIGNLGWIAGYLAGTSPSKTNAFGYLKRIGNPDYYDANDSWSGYKFLGSGNWNDFNTIVFALGINDGNYPLGSLSDIDDTVDYETVMSWKCSAADTSTSNRTIVKAIYQCYRYIRESEAKHAEGEPYAEGGSKINIILSDPLITGSSDTGSAPEWSYNRTLTGGYTRKQLNQLLHDFAEKYGCGHISNYGAPIDRMEITNSLPDGIHPNRTTYEQLGRYFAGKISALVL